MRFSNSITAQPAADPTANVVDSTRTPALLWLGLRLSTWIFAIFISSLLPFIAREQAIAAWPPSAPFGAWLERVVLAPWERWDVEWYVQIVAQGYRLDDGTAQFHPLLAWLSLPIAHLSGLPLLGLLITSSLAALALFYAFERYARLDHRPEDARTALLLLACAPIGFILFAPYTEGLFMLCSVLSLLFARQQRWWSAGLAGAAAVLTRQQGLFLVVPLAIEIWVHLRQTSDRREQYRRAMRSLPALALVPVGMLIWIVYRALALGDVQPDTSSLQSLIYSLLISPSSSKVVPVQAFLPPWDVLIIAFQQLAVEPRYVATDLVFGLAFLPLVWLAWPRMRWSERAYTLIIVLISFAYYTGPEKPYMGLPRHLLLAFPVFSAIAPHIKGWGRLGLIVLGLLSALFLQLQYHIESWVP